MKNAANIKNLADACAKLAELSLTMEDFIKSMEASFKLIGQGAFRLVFDAGNYVVKVRRHESWEQNPYHLDGSGGIRASNNEERKSFTNLKRKCHHLVPFVVEPHYFKLLNGNDIIIMEKVTALGAYLGCAKDEVGYYGEADPDDMPKNIERGYDFITGSFSDSHFNNLGVNSKGLVVMLDLNYGGTYSNAEDADGIADAKNVYKKVTGEELPMPRKRKVKAKEVAA